MTSDYLTLIQQHFDIVLDPLAIFLTYLLTQRVKLVVPDRLDKWRPTIAILVGYVVAFGAASLFGGFRQIPFYGLLYGGGAIFLYEIGMKDILSTIGEVTKEKLKWFAKSSGT